MSATQGKKNLLDRFRIVFFVFSIAISGLILWLIIRWAGGIQSIVTNFKLIAITTFIYVFLIYSVGWIIRGIRWKKLLKNTGIQTSIFTSTELIFAGNTLNLVLPAKLGDAARIVGMQDLKKSQTAYSISSVITDRFLDFLAVVILALICIPSIGFGNISKEIYYVIYISMALIILGISYFGYVILKKGDIRWIKKLPKRIQNPIKDLLKGSSLTIRKFPYLEIIYSFIIWILEAVIAYLILLNILGISYNFLIIVLAIMLGNLTKTIPLTPGGIGTYEAVFALVLATIGIDPSLSVSIALIDHMFKNLYTLGFGLISFFHLGINVTQLRKFKEEKTSDINQNDIY